MTTGRPSARCWAIRRRAYGRTAVSRTSAASLAAACTVAWSQPLASLAACRVSSIAGMVSPITSKTLNNSPSPGIFGAVTTPASRRAVEMTGPDAPISNVRSRSKNAAPAMG